MSHSSVLPMWNAPARLLPDSRLTRLAQQGDRGAFEAIFRRHHGELYRYCRAILGNDHDAQDALQGTMIAALNALPGEERDIPLRPWLFRVAHNEAISVTRRRSRDGAGEEPELAAPSAHADVEERERLQTLMADLAALPERGRAALVMRELSGLSYGAIADALAISEGAARQTVYEAREAMREAELGREESCQQVREVISLGDGRKLRGRRIRAHLRACRGCSDFRLAIRQRENDLQLIAPPLSAAAAAALLGGGGSLLGSGAGAAGGAAGAGMLGKAGAVLAIAAAGTGVAGVTGAVDVPGLSASDDPPRAIIDAPPSAGAQAGASADALAAAAQASARRDSRGTSNSGDRPAGGRGDEGGRAAGATADTGSGSSGQGAPAFGSEAAAGPAEQAPAYGSPPAATPTPGTGGGHAGGNSATVRPPPPAPAPDGGSSRSTSAPPPASAPERPSARDSIRG